MGLPYKRYEWHLQLNPTMAGILYEKFTTRWQHLSQVHGDIPKPRITGNNQFEFFVPAGDATNYNDWLAGFIEAWRIALAHASLALTQVRGEDQPQYEL